METIGWFGALTGLFIGLILGSFAGMGSYRWPREENWLKPSHCPQCQKRLGAAQLVPVLSWLWQRGRSSCCGGPISPRYALIELSCGLITALAGWHFGIGPAFILLALLICTLILLSAIDLETGYIPDGSNLTVAGLGALWLVLHPPTSWWEPALSVAQTLAVGVALAWGYSRVRGRDMLGWGDVKLMAASGLWLAPALVPAYLLISGLGGAVFGIIWRKLGGQAEFPFGPALAVTLLLLIGWQQLAF